MIFSGDRQEPQNLRIPGNLLLAGEYAVLLNGGLGIAFAVDRYVKVDLCPQEKFSFSGKAGGRIFSWPEDSFLAALTESLKGHFGALPSLTIHVDSSDLFGAEGTKLGLGSSACTALAAAFGFARFFQKQFTRSELFPLALSAYRHAQGGRGSGYDMAASLYGGILQFTGGITPEVLPLELPWFPEPFYLSPTGFSVNSSSAVEAFEEWPLSRRNRWKSRSNQLLQRCLSAESEQELLENLLLYRREAGEWGKSLGYPAGIDGDDPGETPADHSSKDPVGISSFSKYLGAGDEILWSGSAVEKGFSCRVDRRGLHVC